MKSLRIQPGRLIGRLNKLERCGRYDEALAELREIWEDTTTVPETSDFDPPVAAEIILRCGSLIGFLGHNRQLPNAQERSKNLLTEAHRRFLVINDLEKIVECENYLALAYWRTGELAEARTWIETALGRRLPETSPALMYAAVTKSLILLSAGCSDAVIRELEHRRPMFRDHADDFLKGVFHSNLAVALKNLDEMSGALHNLKLARHFHLRSGHRIYLGIVENNLAQIHKTRGDFVRAHRAVNTAIDIFQKIRDRTREGFSLDTQAQIFFAEKKYVEALKTVDRALMFLEKSENAAYLAETYLTKTRILIALDDITSATMCLFDAVQLAKTHVGEKTARNMVREFEVAVRRQVAPPAPSSAEGKPAGGKLELVLPPSLAHYKEYQAVRIKNRHLEKIGLKPDSLAIVVDREIKRGDLVAISEIKNGSVICGFYDSDFGLVCLEGINSAPQLLNESEVKILGKIIGVCEMEKTPNGKLKVRPIKT